MGYGPPNLWGSYTPFQPKRKGKGVWGGKKGGSKGSQGTYSMESEWYPEPSWHDPWGGGDPQGLPHPWGEQPEEHQFFSLSLTHPESSWEAPPPGGHSGRVLPLAFISLGPEP